MKTILVGYDDTEGAKRALQWAVDLAVKFGAKVRVASVAHLLSPAVGARGLSVVDPVDTPEVHEAELLNARAFLEEHGIAAEYEVGMGDPAETLVAIADAHAADLIVVGTNEPGFVERLLEGSVSQAVARRAHVPVLIVH